MNNTKGSYIAPPPIQGFSFWSNPTSNNTTIVTSPTIATQHPSNHSTVQPAVNKQKHSYALITNTHTKPTPPPTQPITTIVTGAQGVDTDTEMQDAKTVNTELTDNSMQQTIKTMQSNVTVMTEVVQQLTIDIKKAEQARIESNRKIEEQQRIRDKKSEAKEEITKTEKVEEHRQFTSILQGMLNSQNNNRERDDERDRKREEREEERNRKEDEKNRKEEERKRKQEEREETKNRIQQEQE